MQRAHTEWQKKRERTIAAMNEEERMFYDKIEGVKNMNIAEYAPSARQVELIATMYNNNYLNAQYDAFCYGFYQGMEYMRTKR